MENTLREELSELEHIQWEHWSKTVIDQLLKSTVKGTAPSPLDIANNITKKHKSWLVNWKPYSELPEETKEFDREWADKALKIIKKRVEWLKKEIVKWLKKSKKDFTTKNFETVELYGIIDEAFEDVTNKQDL